MNDLARGGVHVGQSFHVTARCGYAYEPLASEGES